MKMPNRFKNLTPVILILIVQKCFSVLNAQTIPFQYINSVKTSSKSFEIEKISRPAQSVVVFGDESDVEKEWKKYSKKNHNISWKGKRSVLQSSAIIIPSISTNSVNLFSKIEAREKESELLLLVEISPDHFIDPGNFRRESGAASQILIDFANEYYLKITEKDLTEFSRKIKILNKDLEKNISARENLEKTVLKESKTLTVEQQSVLENRERIEKDEATILRTDKNITKGLEKGEEGSDKNAKLGLKKDESVQRIAKYENTIMVSDRKITELVSSIENLNLQKQDIETSILQKQALLAEITAIKITLENYKEAFIDKVR